MKVEWLAGWLAGFTVVLEALSYTCEIFRWLHRRLDGDYYSSYEGRYLEFRL